MYTFFIIAIFVLVLVMQNKSRGLTHSIKKLVRQSARYATAAQQDKSPAIHNATGIDVKKFVEHVTNVQDMVTKQTTEKFPDFAGRVDMYLSEIGGESQ